MGTHPIFESDFDCLTEKMVKLGVVFPNPSLKTTKGDFTLHDYIGDSYCLLFSHPADYTPVCTTEMGTVASYAPQFKALNCKLIGLSIDSIEDHHGWIKDIQAYNKLEGEFPFPIISDDRKLAVELEMLDPDELDKSGMPLTARAVFIIGPDKKLKLSILYPATTGRNFDEILRVVDLLQLTAHKKVATPADWKQGSSCMVVPNISKEQAKQMFPQHKVHQVPSGKEYLRTTPQP